MSISLRSALVSQNFNNLEALKNVLKAVMVLQNPVSGYFPYAGSPFGDFSAEYGDLAGCGAWSSDTYNLWTIINFIDYVLMTDDFHFAHQHWARIVRALDATYQYIDPATGLFNGTNAALNARFSTILSNTTFSSNQTRHLKAAAAAAASPIVAGHELLA